MNSLEVRYLGKYIGPEKIEAINEISFKTPLGSSVYELVLSNKAKIILPEAGLNAIATEDARDYNHVFSARANSVIPRIVELIKEFDIPLGQIDLLFKTIAHQIDNEVMRALNFFWTKDDSRFVPGYAPENEATLLMADRVIKEEIPANTLSVNEKES